MTGPYKIEEDATMLTRSMRTLVAEVERTLPDFPRLPKIFADCLVNTYSTTLQPQPDGSVFVITGDIPAMWLRDSAAQSGPICVWLPAIPRWRG